MDNDELREDAADSIATMLNRMEGWAKAYPEEMFHEPTKEERDWLHAERPGLMDCIAASMGRHIAKCMAEDLATLQASLTPILADSDELAALKARIAGARVVTIIPHDEVGEDLPVILPPEPFAVGQRVALLPVGEVE